MKLVLVTLRIGVGIPKGNTGVGWGRVGRGVGIAVRSPHQARVGWGGDPLGIPTAPRRISNNHCNNAAAPIDMRTYSCCCPHRCAHSWLLPP